MTRHSKHNTTSGAFTYAERQKLNYGTRSARCSSDSLRPLTSCCICLSEAIQPSCCYQGHLACRSCFLESIMAQKDLYKEKKARYESDLLKESILEKKKETEQKRKEIEKFLKQQTTTTTRTQLNKKRSHSDHMEEVKDATTERLASYWIPSERDSNALVTAFTSHSNISTRIPPKEEICCTAGTKGPHPLSLKTLLPVIFVEVEDKKLGCPVCLKIFTGNKLKGIVFPGCGHVACDLCHRSLKPTQCFSCNRKLDTEAGEKCLELDSEGTGFAAGGGIVEAKRYDVAFQ